MLWLVVRVPQITSAVLSLAKAANLTLHILYTLANTTLSVDFKDFTFSTSHKGPFIVRRTVPGLLWDHEAAYIDGHCPHLLPKLGQWNRLSTILSTFKSKDCGIASAIMDDHIMRKSFSYSTVEGYFLQDEPTTPDYAKFDYVRIVRAWSLL